MGRMREHTVAIHMSICALGNPKHEASSAWEADTDAWPAQLTLQSHTGHMCRPPPAYRHQLSTPAHNTRNAPSPADRLRYPFLGPHGRDVLLLLPALPSCHG